jgi:hypothetical protein
MDSLSFSFVGFRNLILNLKVKRQLNGKSYIFWLYLKMRAQLGRQIFLIHHSCLAAGIYQNCLTSEATALRLSK